MADALRQSLNLPAVALLAELGPLRFASALKAAGAVPRLPPGADPPCRWRWVGSAPRCGRWSRSMPHSAMPGGPRRLSTASVRQWRRARCSSRAPRRWRPAYW
ncbi:hypothetical protein ACFQU2_31840 [Siccirubricoccus deserti]